MREQPTAAMRKVIELMQTGWELGRSRGASTGRSWWLQKGGCGRSGSSIDVKAQTAWGLWERRLIELNKEGFPTSTYKLNRRNLKSVSPQTGSTLRKNRNE